MPVNSLEPEPINVAPAGDPDARLMLDLAARLAWRAVGRVEPNPLVGCVLVRPGPGAVRERIIGLGHHRRFGGPHAEALALADCRARGHDPAGATAYVTLEPCNAAGRQPPCSEALIAARIARVIYARRDPNPLKAGGAARLLAAGVSCECSADSSRAIALSDPFVKRLATGLPWVIAKWAQTIDGRVATRSGESRWISNDRSRRWVHLARARVDAILTGIGTVRADDPQLTARAVPLRRTATPVIIDPAGELAPTSLLWRAAAHTRVIQVVSRGPGPAAPAPSEPGVGGPAAPSPIQIICDGDGREIALRPLLARLAADFGIASVLTECGPGLLGRLLRDDLIDELHVYTAPILLGDESARPPVRSVPPGPLAEASRWRLELARRSGDDILTVYRRTPPPPTPPVTAPPAHPR